MVLQDPSRPALVKVNLLNGSIRVKAYDGKDVIVEPRYANGKNALKVEQAENVVLVNSGATGPVDVDLQVPLKTSLKLTCLQAGEILVEKVEGEIEASGLTGSVRLLDVSGVVVANSLNGQVKVSMQRVTPDKPMSFSTLNGDIDITLPADTRATAKVETLNGSIQSEFLIQPGGGSGAANRDTGGKPEMPSAWTTEKVRSGTINGGGPEFRFKAFNGSINIHKKGN